MASRKTPTTACPADAKLVCLEKSPGVFEEDSVGRDDDTCQFPTLDNEVALENCPGIDPNEPVACTDDAKLVCVESSPGVFEEKGLGREGPNCEFPTLENEVAYEKCSGATGGTCEEIEERVNEEILALNSCETADDCVQIYGGCPFGCYVFHHKDADLSEYEAVRKAFTDGGCETCDYGCAELTGVACENNKCVGKTD